WSDGNGRVVVERKRSRDGVAARDDVDGGVAAAHVHGDRAAATQGVASAVVEVDGADGLVAAVDVDAELGSRDGGERGGVVDTIGHAASPVAAVGPRVVYVAGPGGIGDGRGAAERHVDAGVGGVIDEC